MNAEPARVLLVNMPFASTTIPSLSVALLQAQLRAHGHVCDLRHCNLELLGWFDEAELETLAYYGNRTGDWLFVPALYGGPVLDDDLERYLPLVADLAGRLGTDDLAATLSDARCRCTDFVDACAESTAWDDYDVIGFTSMFSQTVPSLALARRIRDRHPDLPLLFGGANFHDDMGLAIHESFDLVDIACLGEGDDVVVAAVEALLGRRDPATVPGIVFRDADGRSVRTPPAPMIEDLDDLPLPDYADWLADRERSGLGARQRRLLIETSRGCWWGERSHCTFCGLNVHGMAYRSKSAERTLAEMHHLRSTHDVDVIQACDNILDMRYFHDLLPRLAQAEPPFSIFYDTKASLTHRQVAALAAAGVREILPGIESLGNAVLQRMRKGTTGLVNIQLLKWCAEFGIDVEWNFIHGFPGDRAEDYEAMLPLIDAARHLQPPSNMQAVLIDRFSPFHSEPEALGFTNLRAAPVYEHLYPVDQTRLDRIAYEFEADHVPGWEPCDAEAIIGGPVRAWMAAGSDRGGLWMHTSDRVVHLADQRPHLDRDDTFSFTGWRAWVYARCDRIRTTDELTTDATDREGLVDFLEWCVQRHLMVSDGHRYLGVAVHTPARRHSPDSVRTVVGRHRSIPVRAS